MPQVGGVEPLPATPTPPTADLPRPVEEAAPAAPTGRVGRITAWIRQAWAKHGKKIWWLHSVYALGLGASVVLFAQKGLAHARWLSVSLGIAWLVMLVFFRHFGDGAEQDAKADAPGAKTRFFVMTYVLKNLYQGMLFFLPPFYYKSASLDAHNRWFFVLLVVCAGLSTLDLVFDRVLMRWKILASVFYAVTLFGCMNLVIPALLPDVRTLYALLGAAGVTTIAFFTLHLPLSRLGSHRWLLVLAACIAASMGIVYQARTAVPPVPMYVSSAAVGPAALPDGRLAMTVTSLHQSVMRELMAVTDVVVPGGKGDRLVHVWRREGIEVHRFDEGTSRVEGPEGAVRLRSALGRADLKGKRTGHWTVDVETEDGQLVGRTDFEVVE